jgi:hypothetical protein
MSPCCCLLQLDWRPLLPHIRVPCLNLIGELSGVFPEAGCRAVGDLIPDCHTVSGAACQYSCCFWRAQQLVGCCRLAGCD